ncbi:hypothetical protein PMIN06_011635 [Paraphaeosphaeria minitans]
MDMLRYLGSRLHRIVGAEVQAQDDPAASKPPMDIDDMLAEEEFSEDEREKWYQTRTWGPFMAITDETFSYLVHLHMEKHGKVSGTLFRVENRLHGSYNYAVVLGNGISKLVVKIPVVGTKDRWDPGHANIMRSEAHTLMYIKHKLPHFPCPELLAKDETFDNPISAPYLMQSFLEGRLAQDLWYEGLPVAGDHLVGQEDSNKPPEELETKRIAFLSSLATTMAELRHLEFDSIGMLYLENEADPESFYIGPHYDFSGMLKRVYIERRVFKTSTALYIQQRMRHCGTDTDGADFMRAEVLKSAPFAASKKRQTDDQETFTLSFNDLDLQNVLVNDAGDVTGILDWDDVTILPRCVGFTTVPVFLQEDFKWCYSMPNIAELFPWTLTKYRKVYAAAMKKACSDCEEVAQYCEKSALYMAIHNVMYGDRGWGQDREGALMRKLLLEIPELRSANLQALRTYICRDENGDYRMDVCDFWVDRIRQILDPGTK